jgi:hypothetical protein
MLESKEPPQAGAATRHCGGEAKSRKWLWGVHLDGEEDDENAFGIRGCVICAAAGDDDGSFCLFCDFLF